MARVDATGRAVAAAGGGALLASLYAPWYRATSTETFCGFLVEPYGGTGFDDCGGVGRASEVAMAHFHAPALLVLALVEPVRGAWLGLAAATLLTAGCALTITVMAKASHPNGR